jgi:hypothetical protein
MNLLMNLDSALGNALSKNAQKALDTVVDNLDDKQLLQRLEAFVEAQQKARAEQEQAQLLQAWKQEVVIGLGELGLSKTKVSDLITVLAKEASGSKFSSVPAMFRTLQALSQDAMQGQYPDLVTILRGKNKDDTLYGVVGGMSEKELPIMKKYLVDKKVEALENRQKTTLAALNKANAKGVVTQILADSKTGLSLDTIQRNNKNQLFKSDVQAAVREKFGTLIQQERQSDVLFQSLEESKEQRPVQNLRKNKAIVEESKEQ